MRLSARSGKHSASLELSMTSMIDVVFLLLIFFMTTSSFSPTEREIDTGIRTVKATAAQMATQDLQPTIIEVVPGAGGDFVYRLGAREIASQTELTEQLRLLENQTAGAFVRCVDDAPFDMAVAAIQSCKSARFLNVTYVPHPPTP